jgi:hydroxypyruvate isomerase
MQMPKFAANLTMLFTEVPFLDRFEAAAAAGFKAVEFLFPYDYPAEQLQEKLRKNGLKLVLCNLPAGNWAAGDRGIAADPRRQDEFRAGVAKAVLYAEALGVEQLNCLAGKTVADVSVEAQQKALAENVRFAADELAKAGRKLLVEHINTRDIPGFFLATTKQVLDLLAAVDRPNVYLQYDMYHAQRMEGELVGTLTANLDKIAHIQIADNPGRHQPGTGEINYRHVFAAIDKSGYQGYIGLEYVPGEGGTVPTLAWAGEYGYKLS